jgi:predicted molibdopterin-dependent oxidoreductase YjgC
MNLEGRVQTARAALTPVGQSRQGSEIVRSVAEKFGVELCGDDEKLNNEIEPLLQLADDRTLPEEFLEVRRPEAEGESGFRHPLYVIDDPHHAGHLTEKSASLANFVGEAYIELSPEVAAEYKLHDDDSVRVESECGKVILPVKVSSVLRGDAVKAPRNFYTLSVTSLLRRRARVDRVKISKVDE